MAFRHRGMPRTSGTSGSKSGGAPHNKLQKRNKTAAPDFERNHAAKRAKTKLGRSKGQALAANATDTSFRARPLAMPGQRSVMKGRQEAATQRNQTLSELLDKSNHPSAAVRRGALQGLRELGREQPGAVSASAADAFGRCGAMLLDDDDGARTAVVVLLGELFASCGAAAEPFVPLVLVYVRSALTHQVPAVRNDALGAMSAVLAACPTACRPHLPRMTACLLQLLGKLAPSRRSSSLVSRMPIVRSLLTCFELSARHADSDGAATKLARASWLSSRRCDLFVGRGGRAGAAPSSDSGGFAAGEQLDNAVGATAVVWECWLECFVDEPTHLATRAEELATIAALLVHLVVAGSGEARLVTRAAVETHLLNGCFPTHIRGSTNAEAAKLRKVDLAICAIAARVASASAAAADRSWLLPIVECVSSLLAHSAPRLADAECVDAIVLLRQLLPLVDMEAREALWRGIEPQFTQAHEASIVRRECARLFCDCCAEQALAPAGGVERAFLKGICKTLWALGAKDEAASADLLRGLLSFARRGGGGAGRPRQQLYDGIQASLTPFFCVRTASSFRFGPWVRLSPPTRALALHTLHYFTNLQAPLRAAAARCALKVGDAESSSLLLELLGGSGSGTLEEHVAL